MRSTPLPTAAAGANRPLTMSGSATSEGTLSLSADGRYLTLGGYGTAPGLASVGGTTAASTPRVVARVDANAAVDTTTALTDASSGNNMRAAASVDGSGFYTGGGAGGARFAALGATTSTQLAAAPTNVRTVSVVGGQLYLGSGSAPFAGVSSVGTGTPTTAGQTATLFAPSASAYAFTLLDRSPSVPGPDTLYVADDSGSLNGGLLKYSFDGTAWTARGNARPAGAGARGLTGAVASDGTAGLLATTTAGQLVRVTDAAAFVGSASLRAAHLRPRQPPSPAGAGAPRRCSRRGSRTTRPRSAR